LENLFSKGNSKIIQEEIDLLNLLIEKWDSEHNKFEEVDPIRLLISLMEKLKIKPADLVALLNISKGYISEILHYKRAFQRSCS
jgi:HTH-type transcriptional regulator/antitoxin HigA